TYYTEDIDLNDQGRVYGGGGVRASIPFTRLYPDVESTWFNLNGINHKIVLTGNYYVAQSSVPYANLPQLTLPTDDPTHHARPGPARPVHAVLGAARHNPGPRPLHPLPHGDRRPVRPAEVRHPPAGGQPRRHAGRHRGVPGRHPPAPADEARLPRPGAHRGLD